LLMNAQSAPIAITRNGKEQGVLISAKEYVKSNNKLFKRL
jgi:antitoxin Phd